MTDDDQTALQIVQRYNAARDAAATPDAVSAALAAHLSSDHAYRGVMPFYDLTGPDALAGTVWAPLHAAATTRQRRTDILFASHHDLNPTGGLWVVEMGNILFDFTTSWLGIPPTGKATYLPYATLSRVAGDRIVETVEFLDLLAVLTQAGRNPFAQHQSGGHMMLPGPRAHDGLVTHAPDPADTCATYDLSTAMLTDLAQSYTSPADHLARWWHPDMNWFGPTGIGTSLGFPGYRRGHTGPFETLLDTVEIHDWELAVAAGNFSAVMWWPCLTMRNTGGYMGVPANDALAQMRVVDLYRRDGDKLAENWIFIDLLHFLNMQGVDLLTDNGGPDVQT